MSGMADNRSVIIRFLLILGLILQPIAAREALAPWPGSCDCGGSATDPECSDCECDTPENDGRVPDPIEAPAPTVKAVPITYEDRDATPMIRTAEPLPALFSGSICRSSWPVPHASFCVWLT